MSSNVGLSTPRGSGTSGYVQRNLSNLRPRDRDAAAPYPTDRDNYSHRQRKPDEGILEHDRKREIEVKVFELRDRLEDEGVDEDEIELQTSTLRKTLTQQSSTTAGRSAKGLKPHQVHELAKAKIEESEKLRRALGIKADYEEGGHWRKQEERLREGNLARAREDAAKEEP
ncbi:MAG: RNA-splicing factor [Caeruleum heppii]|nr:MAG: RNA-splicing factor [Caeruleum heppii]